MSWDAYRDNLIATRNVNNVAIIGLDGSTWTSTPGMKLSTSESSNIINGFKNSSKLAAAGIHVNGQRYVFIRSNDSTIHGKLKQSGVIAAKTSRGVIVATYPENAQPGNASNTVGKMQDYLISVGY